MFAATGIPNELSGVPVVVIGAIMLKSCSRCGKVHEKGYVCSAGKVLQPRESEADRFRNKQIWRKKAAQIKKRDYQMCRVCERGEYNTVIRYNAHNISVHHIVPLEEDFTRRLDDENLITLCRYHHELAEKDEIPRDFLKNLADTPLPLPESRE